MDLHGVQSTLGTHARPNSIHPKLQVLGENRLRQSLIRGERRHLDDVVLMAGKLIYNPPREDPGHNCSPIVEAPPLETLNEGALWECDCGLLFRLSLSLHASLRKDYKYWTLEQEENLSMLEKSTLARTT